MNKIFEKENFIFGFVWGTLVIFLAGFLLKAIEIIQKITDILFEWALKIFIFPSLIADWLKLDGTLKYALIIAFTVITAPIVRKAFDWLRGIFKKSPI